MQFLKTRSDFFRNLVTLVTGSSIAQLIGVGLSPVLSRMYSPHEFGLLAAFMSVLSALSVVACLRYEFAIIPAKKDKEAESLLGLCFRIAMYIGLLTFAGVLIFISLNQINSQLETWLWFLPLMLFVNGSYQAMISWANRYKGYKIISRYRIANAILVNVIILIAGVTGYTSMGLLAGYIIGGGVAAALLFFDIQKNSKPFGLDSREKNFKEIAVRYSVFPKVNMPQAFAEMLLINGVIYFLTLFFSPAIVGLYGLTMRVLQAPFNLIGYGIGQVFYQQAVEEYHAGKNIQHLVKKSILRASLIGLPLVIVLITSGPQLFAWVFGVQWRQAGVFAQILAPWFLMDFIKTPLTQIPVLLGKQRQWFMFSLIGNVLMIVAMFYGGWYIGTVMAAVISFSFVQFCFLGVSVWWVFKISSSTNLQGIVQKKNRTD